MNAQIFKIVLTGLIVFGQIAGILLIGQPREPLKPAVAVGNLIVNSLILFGLWYYL